jgi:hypothetical protein
MGVAPRNLTTNGLWNHFTGKKKYIITCGKCNHTYKDKVYFENTDIASSKCPCCSEQNTWSHSEIVRRYNLITNSQ